MQSRPEAQVGEAGKHKFNDDLLLEAEDRALAARQYPSVFHILDHPGLRDVFSVHDRSANAAKRSGRQLGLWAIALIYAALLSASVEPLVTHHAELQPLWPTVLGVLSGAAGLAGVLIGATGILYAKRKRHWIYERLFAERIRQFHFQTFILRLPEIVRSLESDEAKKEYLIARDVWFDAFVQRLQGKLDSAFAAVITDERGSKSWVQGDRQPNLKPGNQEELGPLFLAYRELRIVHQLAYAHYKLMEDEHNLRDKPRRQAAILGIIGFLCIVAICGIHLFIVFAAILAPSLLASHGLPASIATIGFALTALAIRAIDEGLQPEREIERYQQYRSSLQAILDRFDQVSTTGAKLRIMAEMERLSYDEMRNFLITSERSRFVM